MVLDKFIIKSKKGFTLIELLIVVAIIGILAAIAIPQFAAYRERAFNSAAQNDLRTTRTSLEGFFTDNFSYPRIATDVINTTSVLTLAASAEQVASPGPPAIPFLRAAPELDIALSSNVSAIYRNNTPNWFAIGTSSLGGTRSYATAQNVSIIYSKDKLPGFGPDWTGLPATAAAAPVDFAVVTIWTAN